MSTLLLIFIGMLIGWHVEKLIYVAPAIDWLKQKIRNV